MSIALLFAGLLLLTLLHELGHAAAARAFGLHVTVFSVGFGPPFARWQWGRTEVLLCVVPFGGFVRVAELVGEASPRPSLPRVLVLTLAGSGANYLVAALLAVVLSVGWGVDRGATLGLEVTKTSEHAAAAGLREGDVVTAADGRPVRGVADLQEVFSAAGQRLVRLELLRAGQPLQLRVSAAGPGKHGLGARYVPKPELVRMGFVASVAHGLADPVHRAAAVVSGIPKMLAPGTANRPVSPVGLASRVAQSGRWDARRVLSFAALLSVVVGLFNLLPLPGLDGGKLVIACGEAALRRRVPTRASLLLQLAGALLLLLAWAALAALDAHTWLRH